MGKIKKILENELVGGTQTTDIYPVTSVNAVYDKNNERLDNIINKIDNTINKIEPGITYDVSANNDGAVFESLQSLLSSSNLSTLIPTSVRHGGMTIRFIQGSEQSSDNRYIQYRLVAPNWSTDIHDWTSEDPYFVDKIMQEVNEAIDKNTPIEISGDVTNAPDEEDLTSVNVGGTDVLKFKDKTYNPLIYSGMGRIIPRKNIVSGVNTLTQSMINQANTVYVIQYDFTLNKDITIPANCVLEFDGGSVSGRKVTLSNNCHIVGGTFNTCLVEANNVSNITINDTVFDGHLVSMDTMANFTNSRYVVFKNLTFKNFEHEWTDNYNLVKFDHCDNIIFSGITIDNIYPEGPAFLYCSNIAIDKVTHIDDRGIGSHLNIFYSQDVKIHNCYFDHKLTVASTINICAKNVVISNCTFIGGQGIDISNETQVDYTSENVLIIGCTIKNTTGFGIYTYPTYVSVHDVVIDSCKIEAKRALGARDSYNITCINSSIICESFLVNSKNSENRNGNFIIENCSITCKERFMSVDGSNINYDGDYNIKNCEILLKSGAVGLLVWALTGSAKNINFINSNIYCESSLNDIYHSSGTLTLDGLKFENCFITNLSCRSIENRICIGNYFNNCSINSYQNNIFKNNKMQAAQAPVIVYQFEYSNFNNTIISENDFGENYISFRQDVYAANMVFENNSNYLIYNNTNITKAKLKNTLLSRNTYSLDTGVLGTTADRPNNPHIGFCYIDTSLSPARPIWYDGNKTTGWIDATGTPI